MNGGSLAASSKSAFYAFPASKAQFLTRDIKQSQIVSALWTRFKEESVCADNTLPAELKPKVEIYQEVKEIHKEDSSFVLKLKQNFQYGKAVMNFYKVGVVNVWNNRKVSNRLKKKHYKLGGIVDRKGRESEIRIPNVTKLTADMAQALYISQMETKTENDKNVGNVIKGDFASKVIDTDLFSMTRKEFQTIRRTTEDAPKIPLFAVILLIFMESTPLVCYAFPQITPSTCVLPSILPRLWSSSANDKLHEINSKLFKTTGLPDLALRNAYNLPIEEGRLMARTLRLTSKFVPLSLYPESLVRRRLQEHYNYLKVDNYYLSGLNGAKSGNLWNLSNQELILACLERNLIRDIKGDVKTFHDIKDPQVRKESEMRFFRKLRLRLFQFIVDFDNYNIGYLGLTHLLEDTRAPQKILEWHDLDN
ncbi:hypothetical protein G9P44_000831 [Scheffersomyces stipitis]|nr:hypothetical protein G9P44_000831 [Scheffersomyces stipitis]